MLLYHTGFQEIRDPDLHYGRKNADFGQGFYLTSNLAFAQRWTKERKNQPAVLNTYELDLTDLTVHRFLRNTAWYDYIFNNRADCICIYSVSRYSSIKYENWARNLLGEGCL